MLFLSSSEILIIFSELILRCGMTLDRPPPLPQKGNKENKINSYSIEYLHVQLLPLINNMMVYFYSLYLNNINY